MNSATPPSPRKQYMINNPLRATKKATRVSVLLDDELCMRKFIDTRMLDNGVEIILQPRAKSAVSTMGASPLALIDLEIPGATGPLDDGSWGINNAAAQSHFPLQGLQLYIQPWSVMGIGDSYQIVLNGSTQVASGTITNEEELGARVVAFVPSARLKPGSHTLSYAIKRVDRQPEASDPLPILVKFDAPGGVDEDDSIPGHSALKFSLPPEIEQNGVDKDTAEKGVIATVSPYPNMAEGDDIRLSWGGHFVHHHPVTQAQVGKDIQITVDTDTLLAAGDSDDEGLAVAFEVFDQVLNRSSDWSAEKRIKVTTNPSLLDGPILAQALEGGLDLDGLGENPATLQIVVRSSAFAKGDRVTTRACGTTTEGDLVKHDEPPFIIQQLPCIVDVLMSNAALRRLAQTQAVFTYSRERAGATAFSRGQFISITGHAVGMAAPIARDAAQGALDPSLARTVIEIPWDDSMVVGDVIRLCWIGTRPDLTVYDPELGPHIITGREATNKLPVTFRVDGAHLKTLDGGTLQLHFELVKDVEGSIVVRGSAKMLELRVEKLQAELPAPTVPGSEDGTLDLASITDEATVVIPAWLPEMTAGDHVYLTWQHNDGTVLTLDRGITGNAVGKDVTFNVPLAEVAKSVNGTVNLSYVVMPLDGDDRPSPPWSFNLVANIIPIVSSLKETGGSEIPEGETQVAINVTVTGTATATQAVDILDGTTSKGKVTANASGVWTKDLPNLSVGAHSITAKALYGNNLVSPARTFSLSRGVIPTIDTLTDSMDNSIPDDGSTSDTTLKLVGKGTAGRRVEVLDNDANRYFATAEASGKWTATIHEVTLGHHTFKARADYSNRPVSTERKLTAVQVKEVSITSVTDSKGPISNGGTTTETSVTVSGTVTYQ